MPQRSTWRARPAAAACTKGRPTAAPAAVRRRTGDLRSPAPRSTPQCCPSAPGQWPQRRVGRRCRSSIACASVAAAALDLASRAGGGRVGRCSRPTAAATAMARHRAGNPRSLASRSTPQRPTWRAWTAAAARTRWRPTTALATAAVRRRAAELVILDRLRLHLRSTWPALDLACPVSDRSVHQARAGSSRSSGASSSW